MTDPKVVRMRVLIVSSFVVNFIAQMYGILAKPNMKDVADANHFAFSPQPFFIAAFFSMQVVIQAYWLKGFFVYEDPMFNPSPAQHTYDEDTASTDQVDDHDDIQLYRGPERSMMAYGPIYALGNYCIAAWMIFWMNSLFWLSQLSVTINSFAQLYAVFFLLSPSSEFRMTSKNRWTHIVAKTFAGIGVLDFLDNGAVALRYPAPDVHSNSGPAVIGLTFVIFTLLALTSDPLFGVCLVYDLLGVIVGHTDGNWRKALWVTFAAVIVVVAGKIVVPPQARAHFQQ